MSKKHSAGPYRKTSDPGGWMASHDGLGCSEYQAIVDADGKVIALVVEAADDPWAALDTDPNANLFSAAQDLLEALTIASAVLDRVYLDVMLSDGMPLKGLIDARNKSCAAIAKATEKGGHHG